MWGNKHNFTCTKAAFYTVLSVRNSQPRELIFSFVFLCSNEAVVVFVALLSLVNENHWKLKKKEKKKEINPKEKSRKCRSIIEVNQITIDLEFRVNSIKFEGHKKRVRVQKKIVKSETNDKAGIRKKYIEN